MHSPHHFQPVNSRDSLSALLPPDAGALEDFPVVERRIIWDQMLVAATGSADAAAYVFDAGGNRGEQGDFIQKLDGHKNRVYSATFHPTQVLFLFEAKMSFVSCVFCNI